MDSREIYKVTEYLLSLISWDKEWIHFDTGDNVKYTLLEELIADYLNDDRLLFVYGRTNSGQINKQEVLEIISPILGKDDFFLWTINLDKVIQFKKNRSFMSWEKEG